MFESLEDSPVREKAGQHADVPAVRSDESNDENSKDRLISELRTRLRELEGQAQKPGTATEEALHESEEKYRSLVDSIEDSIFLVDSSCRFLFMNRKYMTRLGLLADWCKGEPYGRYHSPQETGDFAKRVERAFRTGEPDQYEHKSRRDGRCFLRTLSPVRDKQGAISAITVVAKDITDRKQMEEKLHELSITDELTGLYNRRGFQTFAGHQLKLSKRLKKGLYMLYADLDNLKTINDTFGHAEGDAVIKEVADILKDCFRDSDVIARIGGDEFAIIPIGTVGDNIESVISRLRSTTEAHNVARKTGHPISLSVGIAFYDPANPCSVDELLLQADKAMYEQKRNRKQPTA